MVLAKITLWSEIWWSASLVHMIKWCENNFLKFILPASSHSPLWIVHRRDLNPPKKIFGAQIRPLSDKCDFEGK